MAVLPLTYYPAPLLRQVAARVTDVTAAAIQRLVLDLRETMLAAPGIGLAAPQVGTLQRVIVVSVEQGVLPLVNPEIVDVSRRVESGEEGCLSLPGVFGWVKRPWRIQVTALAPSGEPLQFTAEALVARIIQHEVDHLNGILFIDRTHKFTAGAAQLHELWRQRKT